MGCADAEPFCSCWFAEPGGSRRTTAQECQPARGEQPSSGQKPGQELGYGAGNGSRNGLAHGPGLGLGTRDGGIQPSVAGPSLNAHPLRILIITWQKRRCFFDIRMFCPPAKWPSSCSVLLPVMTKYSSPPASGPTTHDPDLHSPD